MLNVRSEMLNVRSQEVKYDPEMGLLPVLFSTSGIGDPGLGAVDRVLPAAAVPRGAWGVISALMTPYSRELGVQELLCMYRSLVWVKRTSGCSMPRTVSRAKAIKLIDSVTSSRYHTGMEGNYGLCILPFLIETADLCNPTALGSHRIKC